LWQRDGSGYFHSFTHPFAFATQSEGIFEQTAPTLLDREKWMRAIKECTKPCGAAGLAQPAASGSSPCANAGNQHLIEMADVEESIFSLSYWFETAEEKQKKRESAYANQPALLTCLAISCLNAIDETVCGSPYCAEHEHHPVEKASFEVVRQVLIDIRESTGYSGWNGKDQDGSVKKEGWDKLETFTAMEELGFKRDANYITSLLSRGVNGVVVADGKLVSINLCCCNLTGTNLPALFHKPRYSFHL
jgi:hypothetical protein